jgi:2Fe-2S ferredoxin
MAMPTDKYRITFMPMNLTVDVDPDKFPYEHNGLPGSILDIALGNGIEMDHACGGVCACSTCHVVVKEGFDTLNEPTEEEEDQLEEAPGLKPTSRLACQTVPDGTTDIVVEIPEWNRNLVQEGQ